MKAITLLSSSLFVAAVSAVKYPIRRETSSPGFKAGGVSNPSVTFGAQDDDDILVENHDDVVYTTPITLGGKEYKVQLSTGSADLWVYSTDKPSTSNKTNYEITLTYDIGQVQGYVAFADFEFGDYKVPSQAFIDVDKAADIEAYTKRGIAGVLGLSFDSLSEVNQVVRKNQGNDSTAGRSPISNIFHQNPNLPNFISVLLGRTGDLDDEVEGMFTISEYVEEFKAVQHEPKLTRKTIEGAASAWNIEVEGISVNNNSIQLESDFSGVSQGSVIALLDIGYSRPPIDTYIADAIYGSIPGAIKTQSGHWVVPCLNSTEVVFRFAGKDVPVHPLDLTYTQIVQSPDGEEYTVCFNSFEAKDDLADTDIILGSPFLKNVYALFDWGMETDGSAELPFVQLLATTTFAEAVPEFLHSRGETLKVLPKELPPTELLAKFGEKPIEHYPGTNNSTSSSTGNGNNSNGNNGNNTNGSKGNNTSEGTNGNINNLSSAGSTDDDTKFDELISKVGGYGPVIIGLLAANLLFVLVLTAIGVYLCLRRRGKAKTVNASYAPVKLKESDNHSGFSTAYNTPYNA